MRSPSTYGPSRCRAPSARSFAAENQAASASVTASTRAPNTTPKAVRSTPSGAYASSALISTAMPMSYAGSQRQAPITAPP